MPVDRGTLATPSLINIDAKKNVIFPFLCKKHFIIIHCKGATKTSLNRENSDAIGNVSKPFIGQGALV